MSHQSTSPPREQRRRDWIPGLIGAALGAAAVIVAALIGTATNTVNVVVGSPPTSVLTMTVTPSGPRPTTSPSPTGGGSPDLPGGVTVRRSTDGRLITLRSQSGVDLDDNLSPNWLVKDGPVGSSAGFGSDIGRIFATGGLDLIGDYAFEDKVEGYATCAEETGYTRGDIERGSLPQGQQLCLRTDQHRYAAVTIEAISADRVQLSVVVWDPPDE